MMDMSRDFWITDLMNLTGLNLFHALIAVLVAAGLIWLVSANSSPTHKLVGSVFVSAAAATAIVVMLKAIAMWM
jgi:hypothetical protein